MKYIVIILFITLSFGTNFDAHAQTTGKLELRSNFFGSKFYKEDSIIGINQVLEEMAPNEAVYNLMISAKKDNLLAQVLGAAGGLMAGFTIGTAIGGGEPNWTIGGIGAGLIAISIPISSNFKKKAYSAIQQHNSIISASNTRHLKPMYSLGFGQTGLKLQMKF